jgi:hypothetical protein
MPAPSEIPATNPAGLGAAADQAIAACGGDVAAAEAISSASTCADGCRRREPPKSGFASKSMVA